MIFSAIRFFGLLAVAVAAPLASELDTHSTRSVELPNQATIASDTERDTNTKAGAPDTRDAGEPTCDPLTAVGDVLGAVPIFLSAHGGFELALAQAVESLDGCTIQYFGQIILGAGQSPLGSLCR
mmetsp:Transcript_18492/g.60530  ORF Transcript_18492/g.60530 Transcript_18492/m.60530 type:complete len:125 (+) Transcript_18492:61-435(+)|eukprot:scaffold28261_cov112-Isochrysis_galbana.AAC.6